MNGSNINQIEVNYPVGEIRANGFAMWPVLRIYLGDKLLFDKDRRVKIAAINKKLFIKSLLFGLFPIFKKADYLVFSVNSQRRILNGFMVDRFDYLTEKLSNCLFAESPSPLHSKRSQIPTKNIMSKSWFHVFEMMISVFFRPRWKGNDILHQILQESGQQLEYRSIAKRYLAQYKIMKFLIKHKKIKALFLITSYTNMGYVKACRDSSIPVVEMQHGVINASHYAYNVAVDIDAHNYPDYLLTWGNFEKHIFSEKNFFIQQDNVYPVGHFYLDYINSRNNTDEVLQQKLSGYKLTLAFTAQDAFEEKVLPLIIELAQRKPEWAIVYIPRRKTEDQYPTLPCNIIFASHLNCYQIIAQTDWHITVSSTCALEAPAIGKPNVLLNFENRSQLFFGATFSGKTHTRFVRDIDELITSLENDFIPNRSTIIDESNELFAADFKNNVINFISQVFHK
ncbi:MAG: hypothetical protein KBB11_00025 [Bacteroidales bacterium]|nr:hypothetical protein [Bacteroidales bacterium]HOY39445.1 hypothetical protein [Bacteroidales bacterium]HQP03901.1 hypothetical protein [Bacteroidales bacterium]